MDAEDRQCAQLMAVYERQIAEVEACTQSFFTWDGYCGLVKVCNEDLVGGSLSREATARSSDQEPPASPLRGGSSAGTTPLNRSPAPSPAKGAAPSDAHARPQGGAPPDAPGNSGELAATRRSLLAALEQCPLGDALRAARLVESILEVEAQLGLGQPAPGAAPRDPPGAPAAADAASFQRELYLATESLSRGEARRALQHLERAGAAAPAGPSTQRRRIELYLRLIKSKRHL